MNPPGSPVAERLESLRHEFALDAAGARQLIGRIHEEMRSGLAGGRSSLKMLSSFTRHPTGRERGRYLALDLGGTNFRVMAVELSGERSFEILRETRIAIPGELRSGDGERLFDFIASSLDAFLGESGLPGDGRYGLGFTFSFPVRQTGVKAGTLIQWTKGFTAGGVVGNDVVVLLERALRRRGIGCVSVDALVNDTVGTLVAKSYEREGCKLGVILGTGTNACYSEKGKDGVIVNMEWGGFAGFEGNAFDRTLDAASANPGSQLFEKAVSGMYLGEIARLVLVGMAKEGLVAAPEGPAYSLTSEHLSRLVGSAPASGDGVARAVAEIVSTRSAHLAAMALAAVLLWQEERLAEDGVVAIDGSLFEKFPGDRETMVAFLEELLGEHARNVHVEDARDGSGVGAAIIAAIASGTRPESGTP